MQIEGAVIKEQGITFAVAVVRPSVLNQPSTRDQAVAEFSEVFDGLPTVLMAQDSRGVPSYYGRPDIVDFMASVPLEAIPWQRYWLN
jgi:hypothetical protein